MALLLKLAVLALLSEGITAELRGAGHRQLQVDAKFSKSTSAGGLSAAGSQVMSSWLTAAWEQAPGAQQQGQPGSQSAGKPLPKPGIGGCIFIACFAIPFGLVGVSMGFGTIKTISSSVICYSPYAKRADARITSIDYVERSRITRFTFKCLRDDGLMVVVEAEESNGPSVSENSTASVLYYPSNPGNCILEGSSSDPAPPLPIMLIFGVTFTSVSLLVGVLVAYGCGLKASGHVGALIPPGIFLGCVGYCFVSFVYPIIDAYFPKLLGSKVVLADAPNIAGLWQLDSELGAFVYSFQVNGAEVEVKGRQQSEESWASSCRGEFLDADTLGWNDQDNSHFRMAFCGDKCTGSVHTDSGQQLEFKGFLLP